MFDPKTKILVVDDMLTMRKIVSKILRELGFSDITEAANGKDAWEKAQNGNFGLIVSDWNMPICTGIELLKLIRSHELTMKTPFLLVTAEAEQHQVTEAIESGVDQYVVKPFSRDGLKMKLELVYKRCVARKTA